MCGRGRLFPDTEQPPQNAPHAAGRTPHHDLHALTSCHASTPRRRRSAETPPETSGTPPETRRRSGCPVPAPARRSPETSFRRHIVARYIPPLLQYMKERTRRAWRAARRRGGASCHSEFIGANDAVRPFPAIPSQCEHWRGNPSPSKKKNGLPRRFAPRSKYPWGAPRNDSEAVLLGRTESSAPTRQNKTARNGTSRRRPLHAVQHTVP